MSCGTSPGPLDRRPSRPRGVRFRVPRHSEDHNEALFLSECGFRCMGLPAVAGAFSSNLQADTPSTHPGSAFSGRHIAKRMEGNLIPPCMH